LFWDVSKWLSVEHWQPFFHINWWWLLKIGIRYPSLILISDILISIQNLRFESCCKVPHLSLRGNHQTSCLCNWFTLLHRFRFGNFKLVATS
jgi:hypothetical protein